MGFRWSPFHYWQDVHGSRQLAVNGTSPMPQSARQNSIHICGSCCIPALYLALRVSPMRKSMMVIIFVGSFKMPRNFALAEADRVR